MKNAKPTSKSFASAETGMPVLPAVTLSEAQARAAYGDARSLVVSAAAGSGKTRVLVERFARAVIERGVAPERIIAITYTQKAADELRERIERRLAEAGRGLLGGREPAIGTIHGFCLRLLEENAIDAGLDPAFRVLQGDLYHGVLEEAVDETLDEAMRAEPDRFGPLFEYTEPGALKEALTAGYERSRTLGQRAAAGPAPDTGALRQRTDTWLAGLREWKKSLPEKLADRLEHIPDAAGDPQQSIEALSELSAPIRLNGRTRAHAEEAAAFAEELEGLIADWADCIAAPFNGLFVELLRRFTSAVELRKRAGSWVDLHDLMDRVIGLLERPAFRARVREDYEALFIDEFQDVNALQAKLLARLGADLEVFTVGDARQAIYGFRHADSDFFVQGFERAKAEGRAIEIPDNYRSAPGLVRWINALFERGRTGGVFGALAPARATSAASPVRILWTAPTGERKHSADELRSCEADHAAGEIRAMIDRGETAAGETVILLRSMTALPAYEEALRRHGVPYHVTRGRGFYEKSEIVDLLNLFRALRSPDEPLYAAALLRSPFAAVPDEAIWRMFRRASVGEGEVPTLGERVALALQNERMTDAHASIAAFWDWFAPLTGARQELTLSELLERALRSSPFEALTLAQPDGIRRYANIRKFKDTLREFEGLYGSNIDAFVTQLEARMDWRAEEEETEVPVSAERGEAVRIMTVHASKGLEFGTVVIGDMSGTAPKLRSEDVFIVDESARVLSCPPPADGEGKRTPSASYLEYRGRRSVKESDESLRLLYVAATRAKERLILCGALPAKEKKEGAARSWTDVVLEAFGDDVTETGRIELDGICWEVKRRSVEDPVVFVAGLAAKRSGPSGGPGAPADMAEDPGTAAAEAAAICSALEDRSKPYRQSIDLTVSELAGGDEETDPDRDETSEKFTLTFAGPEVPEAESTLLAPASVGHVFHEMLQHISYDQDPEEERARILGDFRHRMDAAAARLFEPALERFLGSGLAADLRASARAGRPIYRELPFFYRVRREERELGSVKGQVDLLFEAPDGKWTLVDYKTTLAEKPEHRRQMELYAFCLKKLLKGRPHRAVLYYSRSGDLRPVDLEVLNDPSFEPALIDRFEQLTGRILNEGGR